MRVGAEQDREGQREVLAGELEQSFSYVTHCINLMQIALIFHQDIYLGMA